MFREMKTFFQNLLRRKPVSYRIKMELQLRVDGSGQVRVIRVPVDEHESAGA